MFNTLPKIPSSNSNNSNTIVSLKSFSAPPTEDEIINNPYSVTPLNKIEGIGRYLNSGEYKNLGYRSNSLDLENDYYNATPGYKQIGNAAGQFFGQAGAALEAQFSKLEQIKETFGSASSDYLEDTFKASNEIREKYPVFKSNKEAYGILGYMPFTEGSFSKWSNFAPNLGFTAGTMLGVFAENLVATAIIEGTTGGAGTPLALGKWIESGYAGVKSILSFNKLMRLQGLAKLGEGAYEGTKVLGAAGNIFRGMDAITAGKSLNGVLHSMYGSYQLYSNATGEALIENSSSVGELMKDFKDNFIEKNGREPNATEYKNMQDAAEGLILPSTLGNIGVLMGSNLLQEMNAFKAGKALSSIAVSGSKMLGAEAGKRVLFDKVKGEFRKATAREILKMDAKSVGRAALGTLSEGFEESAQGIIAKSTQDYFKAKYYDRPISWTDSLANGLAYASSDQGMEEFYAGVVTGGLFSAGGKAINGYQLKREESELKKTGQTFEGLVDQQKNDLNEMIPLLKFNLATSQTSENFKTQIVIEQKIKDALERGDTYAADLYRKQGLAKAMFTAKTYGKDKVLLENFKDLANLEKGDLAKYLEVEEGQLGTKEDFEKNLKHLEEISEIVDVIAEKFKNPFKKYTLADPKYAKLTDANEIKEQFIQDNIAHEAWQSSQELLAGQYFLGKDARESMQNITLDLQKTNVSLDLLATLFAQTSVDKQENARVLKSNRDYYNTKSEHDKVSREIEDLDDLMSDFLMQGDEEEVSSILELKSEKITRLNYLTKKLEENKLSDRNQVLSTTSLNYIKDIENKIADVMTLMQDLKLAKQEDSQQYKDKEKELQYLQDEFGIVMDPTLTVKDKLSKINILKPKDQQLMFDSASIVDNKGISSIEDIIKAYDLLGSIKEDVNYSEGIIDLLNSPEKMNNQSALMLSRIYEARKNLYSNIENDITDTGGSDTDVEIKDNVLDGTLDDAPILPGSNPQANQNVGGSSNKIKDGDLVIYKEEPYNIVKSYISREDGNTYFDLKAEDGTIITGVKRKEFFVEGQGAFQGTEEEEALKAQKEIDEINALINAFIPDTEAGLNELNIKLEQKIQDLIRKRNADLEIRKARANTSVPAEKINALEKQWEDENGLTALRLKLEEVQEYLDALEGTESESEKRKEADRVMASNTSYTDKIRRLKKLGFLTSISIKGKETDTIVYNGRLIHFMNLNGNILPIYRSSNGTSDKVQGEWYPFFGFGNLYEESSFADPNNPTRESMIPTGEVAGFGDSGWLIKGSGKASNSGMDYTIGHGIEAIQFVQNLFNKYISFQASAFANQAEFKSKGYTTDNTETVSTTDRSVLDFNEEIFGVENMGVYSKDSLERNKNSKFPLELVNGVETISATDWISQVVTHIAESYYQKEVDSIQAEGKTIEEIREIEKAELATAIPNIESYKVNGIIKEDLMTPEDLEKYKEIYEKYDKIIMANILARFRNGENLSIEELSLLENKFPAEILREYGYKIEDEDEEPNDKDRPLPDNPSDKEKGYKEPEIGDAENIEDVVMDGSGAETTENDKETTDRIVNAFVQYGDDDVLNYLSDYDFDFYIDNQKEINLLIQQERQKLLDKDKKKTEPEEDLLTQFINKFNNYLLVNEKIDTEESPIRKVLNKIKYSVAPSWFKFKEKEVSINLKEAFEAAAEGNTKISYQNVQSTKTKKYNNFIINNNSKNGVLESYKNFEVFRYQHSLHLNISEENAKQVADALVEFASKNPAYVLIESSYNLARPDNVRIYSKDKKLPAKVLNSLLATLGNINPEDNIVIGGITVNELPSANAVRDFVETIDEDIKPDILSYLGLIGRRAEFLNEDSTDDYRNGLSLESLKVAELLSNAFNEFKKTGKLDNPALVIPILNRQIRKGAFYGELNEIYNTILTNPSFEKIRTDESFQEVFEKLLQKRNELSTFNFGINTLSIGQTIYDSEGESYNVIDHTLLSQASKLSVVIRIQDSNKIIKTITPFEFRSQYGTQPVMVNQTFEDAKKDEEEGKQQADFNAFPRTILTTIANDDNTFYIGSKESGLAQKETFDQNLAVGKLAIQRLTDTIAQYPVFVKVQTPSFEDPKSPLYISKDGPYNPNVPEDVQDFYREGNLKDMSSLNEEEIKSLEAQGIKGFGKVVTLIDKQGNYLKFDENGIENNNGIIPFFVLPKGEFKIENIDNGGRQISYGGRRLQPMEELMAFYERQDAVITEEEIIEQKRQEAEKMDQLHASKDDVILEVQSISKGVTDNNDVITYADLKPLLKSKSVSIVLPLTKGTGQGKLLLTTKNGTSIEMKKKPMGTQMALGVLAYLGMDPEFIRNRYGLEVGPNIKRELDKLKKEIDLKKGNKSKFSPEENLGKTVQNYLEFLSRVMYQGPKGVTVLFNNVFKNEAKGELFEAISFPDYYRDSNNNVQESNSNIIFINKSWERLSPEATPAEIEDQLDQAVQFLSKLSFDTNRNFAENEKGLNFVTMDNVIDIQEVNTMEYLIGKYDVKGIVVNKSLLNGKNKYIVLGDEIASKQTIATTTATETDKKPINTVSADDIDNAIESDESDFGNFFGSLPTIDNLEDTARLTDAVRTNAIVDLISFVKNREREKLKIENPSLKVEELEQLVDKNTRQLIEDIGNKVDDANTNQELDKIIEDITCK